MSGTPVTLSHSIRLRPGAHTGAECVLRATYQGERQQQGGWAGRESPERVTDRDRERGVGGEERNTKNTTSQGERSRVSVKERRVDLESGREQRLRWQ